ncbi:hypothetical protein IA57_04355 [Mangrovimonas yunxiaonensis]|uniref:Uncharacterized protein n=1 Tax=Mangrovimonas yunxiaonensis TaxID=1197477 RepID=A0A084TK42_9FLAO|nr:hypothetical protein [Mangrovimonas yunxiaonensis]KFB01078.1 hypothetical protein IA57_04355 [Mangrovimonas yunxiaonensis]GGH48227.1 hypothetical protein GCM10011364_23640 [Mangrovimonas yunxiaonensis]
MKEFNNKTEREFLKILLRMDEKIEVNLGTFLSKCILNNDRLIQLDNKKISLIFNFKKENELTFIKDLSIIISLIEILKDEKLIFTHINPEILNNRLTKSATEPIPKHIKEKGWVGVTALTNDKEIQNKIQKNSTDYGKWELPTTLSSYILEYIDQFCYVRPELTEYINNGFNTPEQIRFQKTLFWTRIATVISFVGLLIAIIIPISTNNNVEKSKVNEIEKEIKEIIKDTASSKPIDTTIIK